MKKFKYKVSFKVTDTELEKSLIALGYQAYGNNQYPFTASSNYLLTSFGATHDLFGYNNTDSYEVTNKELFLALAAMVDDDTFYKGEWVVSLNDLEPGKQFTKGALYKILKDTPGFQIQNDLGSGDGFGCNNQKFFCKATREEITAHFEKKAPARTSSIYPDWVQGEAERTPSYAIGADPFSIVDRPVDIHGREIKVGDTIKATDKADGCIECGQVTKCVRDWVQIKVEDGVKGFNCECHSFEILKPYDNLPLPASYLDGFLANPLSSESAWMAHEPTWTPMKLSGQSANVVFGKSNFGMSPDFGNDGQLVIIKKPSTKPNLVTI